MTAIKIITKLDYDKKIDSLKNFLKNDKLTPDQVLNNLENEFMYSLPANNIFYHKLENEFIKNDSPHQNYDYKYYIFGKHVSKNDVINFLNKL